MSIEHVSLVAHGFSLQSSVPFLLCLAVTVQPSASFYPVCGELYEHYTSSHSDEECKDRKLVDDSVICCQAVFDSRCYKNV